MKVDSNGSKLRQMPQPIVLSTPDYFSPNIPNYAHSPFPIDYPIVEITDVPGGGSGAAAYARVENGKIASIEIISSGTGYTQDTTVTVTGGSGTGAVASAIIVDSAVKQIIVQQSGSGYIIKGGIRKFVDSLARHGIANKNNLGNYIPIAEPDTVTYPGSDYYEIELGQYIQQLHSDLPPTLLRGYRQTNASDPDVNVFSYDGPLIIAKKDRPVRVLFTNNLPTGEAGNLFIPMDPSVMGAGMGPDGEYYSQNRAGIHLHGGLTPWISDGTMHQWTTPADEITSYPKGASVRDVPDMPDPGPGKMTFFYTNQHSARMMFYHDHSYGITRLNFYVGEMGDYILNDEVEKSLIDNKILPSNDDEIILNIQDKTFVPDIPQLMAQDPTWSISDYGGLGNLWFPHVYMINQNPDAPNMMGANNMGRWDYGPWFWPSTTVQYPPIANPFYDPINVPLEPPTIPTLPNPSQVPESFMDTPTINGTVYPYLEVGQKAYRFRILNASTERYYNLQLYYAKSISGQMWNADGTLNNANVGEVKMVPAIPNQGYPDTWPTDGRAGGVPDPNTSGPEFIQIGNECGFIPAPVVLPNTPIGYIYNRRDITVLNVSLKTLFLGPAERADVIIDFSQVPDGANIILYNDSPAPVPGFDPRLDFYTGDPDLTDSGGSPTTIPGYGPNTRTLMQFRVSSSHGQSSPYDLQALQKALPQAYGASQPPPVIPNAVYNDAFNQQGPTDSYVRVEDTTISFFNGPLQGVTVTNGGSNYTIPPTVSFSGGGGGASAIAQISGLSSITILDGGKDYTSPPDVIITGGGGIGATASATITGEVIAIRMTNVGVGYTSPPLVSITGATGAGATGTAILFQDKIIGVLITNPGSGFTTIPVITFLGGGGAGAAAVAQISNVVNSINITSSGRNYTYPPNIIIDGGSGTGATAIATVATGQVTGIVLMNPGNYQSAPQITITGDGSDASAQAVGYKLTMYPRAIIEEFDPTYGRMNAILGVEVPNSFLVGQVSIPYVDIDPPTEILKVSPINTYQIDDEYIQIWNITHNGVDTHVLHWHLFNVQLINRVGWDGMISPPDDNELGWKEALRLNPLQNTIIAIRVIKPEPPFDIINSYRPLDVTMPIGSTTGFTNIDPNNEPAPVTNEIINFGWEHMWHCHLLGHEEFIMMRPMSFSARPNSPTDVILQSINIGVLVKWIDSSYNETDFTVEKSNTISGPWEEIVTLPSQTSKEMGDTISYVDTDVVHGNTYYYRIIASNTVGYTMTYQPPATGYPIVVSDSEPSRVESITY